MGINMTTKDPDFEKMEKRKEVYECPKCNCKHFKIIYNRISYDTIAIRILKCCDCDWQPEIQSKHDAWLYG
jgi:hypothetical protein